MLKMSLSYLEQKLKQTVFVASPVNAHVLTVHDREIQNKEHESNHFIHFIISLVLI